MENSLFSINGIMGASVASIVIARLAKQANNHILIWGPDWVSAGAFPSRTDHPYKNYTTTTNKHYIRILLVLLY